MKLLKTSIGFIIVSALLLSSNYMQAQEFNALDIIKIADEKNRGETMTGEMTMSIVRPKWERTISMKSWSKGDKYFMIY